MPRQLEDLKAENVNLLNDFVTELLIKKLLESWMNYKQQLKHRRKQMLLLDLITHTIIEDTNRKELVVTREEALASRANMVQHKLKQNQKRYDQRRLNHNKKNNNNNYPHAANPTYNKKKGFCFVCGKSSHRVPQCRQQAVRNDNPPKPKPVLVKGERDDIMCVFYFSF